MWLVSPGTIFEAHPPALGVHVFTKLPDTCSPYYFRLLYDGVNRMGKRDGLQAAHNGVVQLELYAGMQILRTCAVSVWRPLAACGCQHLKCC